MRRPVARGLVRLVVVLVAFNALLFVIPYKGPLPGETTTPGTVVAREYEGRGSGFNAYLVCTPVVRFEAGAGSYEVRSEELHRGWCDTVEGDQVTVIYRPETPESEGRPGRTARLPSPVTHSVLRFGVNALGVVSVFVLLLVLLVDVLTDRRRRDVRSVDQ